MKTIFMVEDDSDNADLVLDYFKESYQFVVYNSSTEAWAAIQSPDARSPDLFLLDIGLPGMDGMRLLQNIRNQSRMSMVPAIALTAHAMDSDEQRFLAIGFDGYVSKPITDFEYLRARIESLTRD
jgi:two-component system cell cycle response regulator DivK